MFGILLQRSIMPLHLSGTQRLMKGVTQMNFALPQVLRDIFGLAPSHDEHLLAGADEESVQALGVSQPVLARFQQDIAVLCPDLVHEAQFGLGRR
jgi:hypothetical protein